MRGLVLAFDTATDDASVALSRDGACIAERTTRAVALLSDADELLRTCGCEREDLAAIAVGAGPGRYTSLRMGIVTARVLSFTLGVPVAGVSTLAALAAGSGTGWPVIDARRGEVFTVDAAGAPVCVAPDVLAADTRLAADRGEEALLVGDGAVRYRELFEAAGASVPPDGDPRHRVRAANVAVLATEFGAADAIEPVYLRLPDAERTRKEFPRA